MRRLMLTAALALLAAGCAYNNPRMTERTTGTNGLVTDRVLRAPSIAFWPATSQMDKQKVTLGKTMSVGTEGLEQSGGGTNMVEALKALDSILGKVRP